MAAAAGVGLGIASVWLPSMQLVGYLLSSYLGPAGLLGCFAAHLTFGTVRELFTPELSGNLELLSVWSQDGNLNLWQVFTLAKNRIGCLLAGIAIAALANLLGFGRIPSELSWVCIVVLMVFLIGDSWRSWLTLLGIGALIQFLSGLGFTNAVIGVVSALGLVQAEANPIQEANYKALSVSTGRATFAGILSGFIPGLNSQSLLLANPGRSPLYQETILASSIAEGISLGLFLWQRPTSKSTLTTFLSQFTRGEQVNGSLLAGLLLLALGFCIALTPVWFWLAKSINQEFEQWFTHRLARLVPLATSFYFFGPGGFIWAIAVWAFAQLFFVRALRRGWISENVRPLVVSVPLLLG